MLRKLLLFISILFLVLVIVWWLPQCSRTTPVTASTGAANPPPSAPTIAPDAAVAIKKMQPDEAEPSPEETQQSPQEPTSVEPEEPAAAGGKSDTAAKPEPEAASSTLETAPQGQGADRAEEKLQLSPQQGKPANGEQEQRGVENPAGGAEKQQAADEKNPAADKGEKPPQPATENTGAPDASDATPSEPTSSKKADTAYVPPRSSGEGAASAGEALFEHLKPLSSTGAESRPDSSTIVLDGVSFATNSDQLTEDSYSVLDNVITSLKKNPDIRLEIAGYTDDRGEPLYNRILSRRRAEAVMIYLVNHGISAKRLTAVGYGSDDPLADNDTPQGRQTNRRVELHIRDTSTPSG